MKTRTLPLVLSVLVSISAFCGARTYQVENLALSAMGAEARSWEPGVHVIAGHEPSRAIDGSIHTYWAVHAEDLPADFGVQWPEPRTVSSVVVRYFDGRMVRGPAMARTQQWARLQYWAGGDWVDIKTQVWGQETSSVRYRFDSVTSTRLRLLFEEPPDPEFMRTPDRLGIYICEFEAYRDSSFQVVEPGVRLVRMHRTNDYYNEWGSEPLFDLQGPLVIEPERSRIFKDTLRPSLIVSESRWATAPCIVREPQQGIVEIGNGFLRLGISTGSELKEVHLANEVTDEVVPLSRATAFRIRTGTGEIDPDDFKVDRVSTEGSTSEVSRVRVDLTSQTADVSVHYELKRQDHFYHKWLSLRNKSSLPLEVLDVTVSSLGLPQPLNLMAGPELTYPIIRMKSGGFFECLETVYWDHQGDTLTYYPGAKIAAGAEFGSEKAVVGVYRNRGEQVEALDLGVRDWVTEYHAHISPIPPGWPDIYIEGWSARIGVQEMQQSPEWTEKFFKTAHDMGVRYMDANEPAEFALLMPSALVARWVDLANRFEIGTGWWNDFGQRFAFGYIPPYIKASECKLAPEAEKLFEDMVKLVRTYKLRGFHWADGFTVWPCNNPNHGHLPGKYSIYAQGQRMIRFNEELHEASPGLMLGADSGLGSPQYGKYAESRHHGGGRDTEPSVEPDIHLDRLYADMNREVLYDRIHEIWLHPWFRALNCVNHFGQATHQHDSAGYRYALLSAIAQAPQLTFNDAPDNIPESDLRFTRYWEQWAKTNQDYLKEGDKLFDRTFREEDVNLGGDQSLTGYAHIRGERGYIFLINPGVVEQVAELTLALNAPATGSFTVKEIYPTGMTLEGEQNGAYPQGGKLMVTVPARQIRILWIAPATESPKPSNIQLEDANVAQWNRYLGDWVVVNQTAGAVTVGTHFQLRSDAQSYLSPRVPETEWSSQPWNYPKAYLVLLLKDENRALGDNWVTDDFGQAAATTAALRRQWQQCKGRLGGRHLCNVHKQSRLRRLIIYPREWRSKDAPRLQDNSTPIPRGDSLLFYGPRSGNEAGRE